MKIYPTSNNTPAGKVKGFSLVELMISITIGLFLLIGMSALLVSNSNTRNEMEKAGRQIENGRYAIQVLSDDLQHAGYYGQFSGVSGTGPVDLDSNCSTDLAVIKTNMAAPVYGKNDASALPSTCGTATSFAAATDILVIRRAGTETPITVTAATANVDQHYIQTTPSEYRLALGSAGADTFNLKEVDLTTAAGLRKYLTHVYFIDKENNVPILMRAELDNGAFNKVRMVEGIDNLQLEYGVDTDSNGSPDIYYPANTVPAWANVMSVRVSVLARNIELTVGYKDTKIYSLGSTTVGPFNDQYKRHVYTAVIRLNNPSGRREL